MCLPLAVLGAIAAVAGSGLNYLGQKKADHAQLNAFNKEHARQQGFEGQQQQAFQDALNGTTQLTDPNAQAAAAGKRTALMDAAIRPAANPGSYLPGSSSAPAVVATDAKAQGEKSDNHVKSLAAALGALGGMTDQMQTNNINVAHQGQKIGQLGSFMNGSQGVLQSELDAAKQKGGNLRMLGGLAQSIGQAMMMGGGGGIPKPSLGPVPVTLPTAMPLPFLSGPSISATMGAI